MASLSDTLQSLLKATKEAQEVLHQLHPNHYHVSVGVGICEWHPCKRLREAIQLADRQTGAQER